MSGTNHNVEFAFLSPLPMKARGTARFILNNMMLEDILAIHFGFRKCERYTNEGFSESDIKLISRQIALAKLTTLEVSYLYTDEELTELLSIVETLFDNGQPVEKTGSTLRHTHPIFYNWLMSVLNALESRQ